MFNQDKALGSPSQGANQYNGSFWGKRCCAWGVQAIINIISKPVNQTVPITAEVLRIYD